MKPIPWILIGMLLVGIGGSGPEVPGAETDGNENEAAIRQSVEAYLQAYNQRDAKALAAWWSTEAEYRSPTSGKRLKGREGLHDHYDHDHLFDDFWSDHPHDHHGFHNNPVFWTWASWNTMAAFMPWNWGTEYYYDYGTGGNVYYEGDTAYASTTPIPASEYAAQAETLATSVPEVANPDAMEWLPLGVFALVPDGDPDAVPNMFLQLAVSKEGIVAGTYQNKTTQKTEAIEGMVDQQSQRAAWTFVGKTKPIMETGLANLTMNETKALVHFSDGQTQQWLMVRVEGPQEGN